MAEVLSTQIANIEAVPQVRNDPWEAQGVLKEAVGVASPAAAQADTDLIRFCQVPSNARVSQVLICAADATTAGAINLGLYKPNSEGGAVVDADLFASALDLTGGPFNNSDQTFESGEYTYAESEKPLWEVLGLTEDPHIMYDVVADISTTFNGGPTSIAVKVRYTV